MRRVVAVFMLALVSLSLLAPALFAADPDAHLPACCRRGGKHRCAMDTAATADSSPGLTSRTCSDYPPAHIGAAGPASWFAHAAVAVHGLDAANRNPGAQDEPFNHSSYSRAGQKRGPPVSPA
jgi:hypothetical protein